MNTITNILSKSALGMAVLAALFFIPAETTHAAPVIPDAGDWNDQGIVLHPGSGWDRRTDGAFNIAGLDKRGSTYYLYYVGADGDRSFDGGPRHRALGVATSDNGVNWTKHSGNPIITHRPNNGEEEGVFSGATWQTGGTTHLFVGTMVGTGGSVNADTDYHTSSNGINFSLQEDKVTDHTTDPGNDEQFVFASYEHNGTWHIFYSAKGGISPQWSLVHAQGSSPDNLTSFTNLGVGVRGGGDVIELSSSKYLLPVSDGWDVRIYSFNPSNPQDLTLETEYSRSTFHGGMKGGWEMYLDRDADRWLFYYKTTDRDGFHLATAPLETTGDSDSGDSDSDDTSDGISAPSGDYIYTNQQELNGIVQKVNQGQQPWRSAFDRVMSSANSALNSQARSVVDNGGREDRPGGVHVWATDAPYQGNDGHYDDRANRDDYAAAGQMGNWIRNLGLAYAMTKDDKYARKAIDLLYHWAVDPDTYMEPTTQTYAHTPELQGNSPIEIFITIPRFIYGASMVKGHPHWDQKGSDAESEFNQWVGELLQDAQEQGEPFKNNHWPWHIVLTSSLADYIDDQDALNQAFGEWRNSTFQINSNGWMTQELDRTRSLHYSMYALKAFMLTAELARRNGVNLYDYTNDKDGSLEKALDFHAPFISVNNPQQEWRSYWENHGQSGWGEQISQINRKDHAIPFELAHSYWQKQPYLDAVQTAGRPLVGRYVWGDTPTLTHGNLFAISETGTLDPPDSGGGGSGGGNQGGSSGGGSSGGGSGTIPDLPAPGSGVSSDLQIISDGLGNRDDSITVGGFFGGRSLLTGEAVTRAELEEQFRQGQQNFAVEPGGFFSTGITQQDTTGDGVQPDLDQTDGAPQEPAFTNPLEAESIPEAISYLLDAVTTIAIPIIILAIIYAGFLFVTAHGDANKLQSAKTILRYTLIGAVVILGAEALADLIVGTLEGI